MNCGAALVSVSSLSAAPGSSLSMAGSTAQDLRALSRRRWGRLTLPLVIHLALFCGAAMITYKVLAGRGVEPSLPPSRSLPGMGVEIPAKQADEQVSAGQKTPKPQRLIRVPAKGRSKVQAVKRPESAAKGAAGSTKSPALSDHDDPPPANEDDPPPAKEEGAAAGGDSTTDPPPGAPAEDGDPQPGRAEHTQATWNADSVRMVVRHNISQVKLCHSRALKQGRRISGMVEIQFTITEQGKVNKASVLRNTTGHEPLGRCVAHLVERWRFPKPVGGEVEFIYPFVFSGGS